MAEISQLGYLAFEVSDTNAWTTFAEDVLGLMVVERAEDGGFNMRNDQHARRFFITPGPRDDLIAVGLECGSEEALLTLVERVRGTGVEVTEADAAARTKRGVARMFCFRDPGNIPLEVYCGPELTGEPVVSKVVATGFVADELGLGHCVLRAKSLSESRAFYLDVLGFQLSDHIICDIGGYKVNICFTHINPRHHSVALGENLPKRLHHFLIQVNSLDDVGMAFDRTVDARHTVTQTIGKHPNDKMVSFYAMSPSGFEFEYGWGAIEVDDSTWEPTTHDRISEWGHRRPPYPRPKK